MANPLLDFDSILVTKRVPGSFNHMSDQYYGWWSRPGGGIYLLKRFKTEEPVLECLTGTFHEPGSGGAASKGAPGVEHANNAVGKASLAQSVE